MNPAHNDIRVLVASRNSRPFVDDAGQDEVRVEGGKAMEIRHSGSQPSGKGPAEYFSGTVRVDRSTRTVPLKYSAGPLPDGCEPLCLISIAFPPSTRTSSCPASSTNGRLLRLATKTRMSL